MSEQLKHESENFVSKLRKFDDFALNCVQEIKKIELPLEDIINKMDSKIVLDYKKIQIVPISTGILQDIDKDKIDKFKVVFFETCLNTNLQGFKAELIKHCNSFATDWFETTFQNDNSSPFPIDDIKVWMLDHKVGRSELFEKIKKGVKTNPTYKYKLGFKGWQLNDANFGENDLLFVETQNRWKSWHFFEDN